MKRVFAILLLVIASGFNANSQNRPIVMRIVDAKTGRESGVISDAQVDEIVRYVRTLRAVDHRVQEVDGASPPEVLVHTGASRFSHGDLLHIERRRGTWVLVSKSKWRLVREPSGKRAVPPLMYEEEK
jgi:hypothetical protein